MSNDKYKCLPCITLIKTGYCPYKKKCQYWKLSDNKKQINITKFFILVHINGE